MRRRDSLVRERFEIQMAMSAEIIFSAISLFEMRYGVTPARGFKAII